MNTLPSFKTSEYLDKGNAKQQRLFRVFAEHRIMEILSDFHPIVTGTIPIELDTEDSDVDICCYCEEHDDFMETVKKFSDKEKFEVQTKQLKGIETTISRFKIEEFSFEIFGQNRPVTEQEAYLHMIKEYEILQREGGDFKRKIIELKRRGLKTEPAFAKLLNLKGDPYEAILLYKI